MSAMSFAVLKSITLAREIKTDGYIFHEINHWILKSITLAREIKTSKNRKYSDFP